MRLLHTSDWHLGLSHKGLSRGADHDHFLAWLADTIAEERVDALIVAGDVFDVSQPSAEAQARLFDFLARVAARGLRQAVIVAGNHDSASRLDAPAAVLRALRVHVVGGIDTSPEALERCLVPLIGADGAVGAVALAVPYVHEYRLGVRVTDLDTSQVRAAYLERFGWLYRQLADEAQRRWPGVPIVATGHLTLGAADPEDYPEAIHQVGQVEAMPPSVLDARIQYAALGHIHRSYPVDEQRKFWYSGSPIAFSLPEARAPRRVLMVEVHPDPAGLPEVRPLEVPVARRLIEVVAPASEVCARVQALTWEEPLPPLLFVRAVAEAHDPQLARRLQEALEAMPEARRPFLVDLRETRPGEALVSLEGPPPDLSASTPLEVFRRLCASRGEGAIDEVASAFQSLQSLGEDDFTTLVETVRGGAA